MQERKVFCMDSLILDEVLQSYHGSFEYLLFLSCFTRLCGSKSSAEVGLLTSTFNQMVVVFKSYYYYSYYSSYYGFNGFEATYNAFDPNGNSILSVFSCSVHLCLLICCVIRVCSVAGR